jgi:hypothetical protein
MDHMWRSLVAATAVALAPFSAKGMPRPATPDGGCVPDLVAAEAETGSPVRHAPWNRRRFLARSTAISHLKSEGGTFTEWLAADYA